MSANKFVLKHHKIEIQYTIGITPGLPALIYKDGPDEKTFKSSEITTNQTSLGSLVSIPLLRTIDTGGEIFGFFLPQLDVASGQTQKFSSLGVYREIRRAGLVSTRPGFVGQHRAARYGADRSRTAGATRGVMNSAEASVT